jgi:LuxR family maltose regulon positive regulatory protein
MGGEMPVNALAHMDLATLHYEWNALEKSAGHLQKAILLSQRGQNDEFLVGCRMLQARLLSAQGNLSDAEEALEKAWDLVRSGKVSEAMAARVDVAQVRLLLAKGKSTGEWSQRLTEKADCHPFYRFMGVTKSQTLPEPHAAAYLDGLSKAAQANEWTYGLIAARVLQATIAKTQDEALGFLSEALQKAENGGFVRSLVEVGEKLVPLLRVAVHRGITPDYAKRILDVMTGKAKIAGAGKGSLVEALSKREIEVLKLVTEGMSNREIAEQLIISPGTAKSHIHNLCGKLGVRNRTEAAIRGKELGLV